jgi:hypothetical protein
MNHKALAEIIATTSLNPLKEAISKSQYNTFIVFDVDEVILTSEDQLFHPHYIDRLMKFDKELATRLKEAEIDNLWSQVFKTRKAVLVDYEFPEILKLIKKNQRHSFALTKSNTGKVGSISKMEDWRINELKSLGVDFSLLSPFKEEIILNYSDYKKGTPMYKEGVIFTCNKDKGKVLEEFLKKSLLKPAYLIFIDDKLENLVSVKKICNKLEIGFLGIHYKVLQEMPHLPLNEEKARLQLYRLETEKKWISDKEL